MSKKVCLEVYEIENEEKVEKHYGKLLGMNFLCSTIVFFISISLCLSKINFLNLSSIIVSGLVLLSSLILIIAYDGK